MIATRLLAVLVLTALGSGACSSPRYKEVQADWPQIEQGHGRIVFLGDNYGWYGIFEGWSWKPVITVDGLVADVDHGTDIYFMAELPAGRHQIGVDGQDLLAVLVSPGETEYVEMTRYAERNDGFSLRKGNYRMQLTHLDETRAKARLDHLEFVGIVK